MKTYGVDAKKTPRPRQVAFAEDCSMILSGSDHGVVYVFDRRSGHQMDALKAGDDRIQSMTVRISIPRFCDLLTVRKAVDVNSVPHVFAAISRGADEASDIVVWQRVPEKVVETEPTERVREKQYGFKDALHFIMFAATLAFVWQNVEVGAVKTVLGMAFY